MYHNTKMATCCYCGTRAILTLKGKERHELACSNCGAPLHEMKMLKAETPQRPEPARIAAPRGRPVRKPKKKKKHGKTLGRKFLSEVWDIAEDVFDVFD